MDTDRADGQPSASDPAQGAAPKPPPSRPQLNAKEHPLEYGFQILIKPLRDSLNRIESALKQAPAPPVDVPQAPPVPPPAAPSAVVEPTVVEPVVLAEIAPAVDHAERDDLRRRLDAWTASLHEFQQATLAEFAALRAVVVPPSAPAPEDSATPLDVELASPFAAPFAAPAVVASIDWERILLGPDLAEDSALTAQRAQFIREITSGGGAACVLAGQLLLLQYATAEEFPERLRPVGEAYYRWRPRTTLAEDPFEACLAAWLTRCGEQSSHRLSIELVRPGDRFDSTRHSAASRGAEIAAVHGWIVVRDRNRVYTKAAVSVK